MNKRTQNMASLLFGWVVRYKIRTVTLCALSDRVRNNCSAVRAHLSILIRHRDIVLLGRVRQAQNNDRHRLTVNGIEGRKEAVDLWDCNRVGLDRWFGHS
jgi:hypothetical protein